MTNILQLQPFGPTSSFAIALNGDWLDQVFFPAANSPPGTPVDITGITFTAYVRKSASDPSNYLTVSTAAGTFVNGGTNGILSFAVPRASMARILPGSYVVDIVAQADGHTIGLFPQGPAALQINPGVTVAP
jgi:hypothetical protein